MFDLDDNVNSANAYEFVLLAGLGSLVFALLYKKIEPKFSSWKNFTQWIAISVGIFSLLIAALFKDNIPTLTLNRFNVYIPVPLFTPIQFRLSGSLIAAVILSYLIISFGLNEGLSYDEPVGKHKRPIYDNRFYAYLISGIWAYKSFFLWLISLKFFVLYLLALAMGYEMGIWYPAMPEDTALPKRLILFLFLFIMTMFLLVLMLTVG